MSFKEGDAIKITFGTSTRSARGKSLDNVKKVDAESMALLFKCVQNHHVYSMANVAWLKGTNLI